MLSPAVRYEKALRCYVKIAWPNSIALSTPARLKMLKCRNFLGEYSGDSCLSFNISKLNNTSFWAIRSGSSVYSSICRTALIYVFGNCKPWRQVLFWMWLAFCILVAVQLFNIGGVTDYKGALKIQFPRYSGLPFTVFPKITALTLITWIAIAGLSVAIPYVDKDAVARCIITLGVLLSLLGITQHHIGIDSFAGVIPLKQPFFSVFAYVNNAGTFFLLCAGLALSRSWRNLPVVVLFAYSTWLTHTRFAWAWFGLFLIIKLTQEETWETLSTGLCLVLSRSLWLSVIAMTTRRIMESLCQEILGRDSEVEAEYTMKGARHALHGQSFPRI